MLLAPPNRSRAALSAAIRTAIALTLAAVALANVLAMAPRPWQQVVFLEQVVDLDNLGWGREGGLVLAGLLLLVARALMRGKRHAWLLSVALLVFSMLSAIVSRAHSSYILFAMLLLVVLLALAPLFPTKSDPRALRRGYLALGVCVLAFVSHGMVAGLWQRELAQGVVHMAAQPRAFILFVLRLILFLSLGYSVVEILRPVLSARRLQRDEHRRARAVVAHYGASTTAHFALGADKSYFWSATERALLAYRLVAGVALLLGDPVGPEEEAAPLLLAFLTYCKRQDWAFAIYQAGPRIRQICRAWDHNAYKVGEEAVVHVTSFTTAGKVGAPVRHAIARAKRDGVRVQCWQGQAVPELIFAGMKRISQTWLEAHGTTTQMGFSMGRFPADWSPELLTAVALDAQGEVQAFLTWTPLYAGIGWSLDNIRRLKETTPGAMEMLIAESIEWARTRGFARMSLGLAPLAGLDSRLRADLYVAAAAQAAEGNPFVHRPSWLERSAGFLYSRKLLLGNYASLYAFKAKFRPVWEPRYLVVTDTRGLPRVLAALMRAHGYTWLWSVIVPALKRILWTQKE
jgi:phosphatidylglycerol lysyltransferase